MEIVDEKTGKPFLSSEDKNNALFTHLASFASFVFPFGNIFGPMIIRMLKKDSSEFVDSHGKESLNFQITYSLVMFLIVASAVAFTVSSGIQDNIKGVFMSIIGFVLALIAYWIMAFIFVIIASVKASNGEYYRYPLSLRFIK